MKFRTGSGFDFSGAEDLIKYLSSTLDYLYFHNKNLTNEQYYRIIDMRDALDSIVDFSD